MALGCGACGVLGEHERVAKMIEGDNFSHRWVAMKILSSVVVESSSVKPRKEITLESAGEIVSAQKYA
jgi:hypothetical protein